MKKINSLLFALGLFLCCSTESIAQDGLQPADDDLLSIVTESPSFAPILIAKGKGSQNGEKYKIYIYRDGDWLVIIMKYKKYNDDCEEEIRILYFV